MCRHHFKTQVFVQYQKWKTTNSLCINFFYISSIWLILHLKWWMSALNLHNQSHIWNFQFSQCLSILVHACPMLIQFLSNSCPIHVHAVRTPTPAQPHLWLTIEHWAAVSIQDHLWSRQNNATFKFVTLMCVGGITGASRWLLPNWYS